MTSSTVVMVMVTMEPERARPGTTRPAGRRTLEHGAIVLTAGEVR